MMSFAKTDGSIESSREWSRPLLMRRTFCVVLALLANLPARRYELWDSQGWLRLDR